MKLLRSIVTVMVVLTLIATETRPVCAEENPFREILETTLYGALTGAVLGAAALAFTKKPGDHLEYLSYGTAGGVIVGVTVGFARAIRPVAEVDNGTVKFAFPTIVPDLQESAGRSSVVRLKAELVRGVF
jgi:hypothetical protein